MSLDTDLIAAVATPPGQGGVGIVRLSGPGARDVVAAFADRPPEPRQAVFCRFFDSSSYDTSSKASSDDSSAAAVKAVAQDAPAELIDEGIVLWFPEGNSFTGEEVVEVHTHGSPVVLQQILDLACNLGARLARPGEFSERAFLNGRLDLTQAEAIADLIASGSVAAARGAARSLRGDFSRRVYKIADGLADLRVLVEACIDFPEEDVEHLQAADAAGRVAAMRHELEQVLADCGQGRLINEGVSIALLGAPNVGKSSLLNALAGEEAAIVTDIPGTTRDLLKVDLVLDGLPVRLVDTAGLRSSGDVVEQIGVERARAQALEADLLVLMFDVTGLPLNPGGQHSSQLREAAQAACAELQVPRDTPVLAVVNKIDLLPDGGAEVSALLHTALHKEKVQTEEPQMEDQAWISVQQGLGLAALRGKMLHALGRTREEVPYTARARHVTALTAAAQHLQQAELQGSSDLMAEELRAAHLYLGEIVGKVTPDDLLGKIFSEFCIGK